MHNGSQRERAIAEEVANGIYARREEIDTRVLNALQERFFESGPLPGFPSDFTAAVDEARMELRAVRPQRNASWSA